MTSLLKPPSKSKPGRYQPLFSIVTRSRFDFALGRTQYAQIIDTTLKKKQKKKPTQTLFEEAQWITSRMNGIKKKRQEKSWSWSWSKSRVSNSVGPAKLIMAVKRVWKKRTGINPIEISMWLAYYVPVRTMISEPESIAEVILLFKQQKLPAPSVGRKRRRIRAGKSML